MFRTPNQTTTRFLHRNAPLSGSWSGFSDSASALSYEVCVGTTPFGCQLHAFAPAAEGTEWLAAGDGMQCGATYHLAVRATNCAGLSRTVASNGAKLCCSEPSVGSVRVVDTEGIEVAYVSNSSLIRAEWSGFDGPCSSVREYTVTVHALSQDGEAVWRVVVDGASSSWVSIPPGVMSHLAHGATYHVVVRATSEAGLTSEAAQASLTVDLTPPSTVAVIDGRLPRDSSCIQAADKPTCSWVNVTDPESGIAELQVGIGSQPLDADLLAFATTSHLAPSGAWQSALASDGTDQLVYCILRITNHAGATTVASSNGARWLSQCYAGVACL